ncbi:MAG TPA: beta-galactosidase GalA [Fimbriimonadaceae bacterium]|nr:beta-galactosidase GalA [Fimbriimonadaceae bacterium]
MNCLAILLLLILATLAGAETPATPRLRIRFDDNWRFREDALPNPKDGNFKWTWKVADDNPGDVQSLPADLDNGDWRNARVGRDVFRGRQGFAWFKTDLGAGARPANTVIHFESVDDNALVFLNGKRLGIHQGWNDPFEMPVGDIWNAAGPNNLVVLVQNTDGPGGVMGPVYLAVPKPPTQDKESRPDFDDHDWKIVHLPHDYVVAGTFTRTADESHGFLPVTTAWYRKTFTLPKEYVDRSVWIDFDGVYRDATVYLNGHKLGTWPSGYIGFRYGINRYANFGGRNVLAVHVDPRKAEGWWYEGGGIYRHVWLNVADPVHVRPWGVSVQTEVPSFAEANVKIRTTLDNSTSSEANCVIVSRILGPDGKPVATNRSSVFVPAHGDHDNSETIGVGSPRLWSPDHPSMYSLETTILQDGNPIDRIVTPFGIRTFYFDPNRGFVLNGQVVKLKGTCNHQDHAGVGIAMPDGLLEWRIKKLKEMGSNAYRCSHNPPAPELLDACDRLGMLVMDETRHLGDTESPKTAAGTGTGDLSEVRDMVLRDRNHPSVVMWSLFNEEPLQGTEEGAQIFTAMRNAVRKLDSTRPCTGAMNGGWGQGITFVEDLQGINYSIGAYDDFHAAFPNLPMFSSEIASTVSTRGIYANDPQRGYVSAYDLNKPGWGETAEESWSAIASRPFMAGEFVWTGFDYKGEPTPYGWPCINSHFGIMDICGFPKDNFFYYQAWWGDKPLVHILPHWNWKGKEGQPIDVWVYSNQPFVELFLNGKSLGVESMPKYGHCEWKVPYEPGWLVAKAYSDLGGITPGVGGSAAKASARRNAATAQVDTTGEPAAIRLKTDVRKILADQEDLSPVEVEIVDAKGRVVPTADNLVTFKVIGSGHVVGVGNGDPSSHEPDKASQRRAFNGLCMALVGDSSHPGRITLEASSPGLKSASIVIESILLPSVQEAAR